jgi:hypothetical protein
LNAVFDDAWFAQSGAKRALRTYHFQFGVTKSVNLECPNGQKFAGVSPV